MKLSSFLKSAQKIGSGNRCRTKIGDLVIDNAKLVYQKDSYWTIIEFQYPQTHYQVYNQESADRISYLRPVKEEKEIRNFQNGDWVVEKTTGKKYQVQGAEGTNIGIYNLFLKDYPALGSQEANRFELCKPPREEKKYTPHSRCKLGICYDSRFGYICEKSFIFSPKEAKIMDSRPIDHICHIDGMDNLPLDAKRKCVVCGKKFVVMRKKIQKINPVSEIQKDSFASLPLFQNIYDKINEIIDVLNSRL